MLRKVEELKIKLKKNEEEAQKSKRKANKAIKVVWKIQNYIKIPNDIVNKVKLFDNGLERIGKLSKEKIIMILVDYLLKMEKILEEMIYTL